MDEEVSQGAEIMTDEDALDELEKSIDNVMTDDDVEHVLSLIERIRHQYEGDSPTKVPALENSEAGASMIAEDALMDGYITSIGCKNKRDSMEVDLTINVPHSIGAPQNFHQNYDSRMD